MSTNNFGEALHSLRESRIALKTSVSKRARISVDDTSQVVETISLSPSTSTTMVQKLHVLLLPSSLRAYCYQYLTLASLVDIHATCHKGRLSLVQYLEHATDIVETETTQLLYGLSLARRHARFLRCITVDIAKNHGLKARVLQSVRHMCVDLIQHNGATLRCVALSDVLFPARVWEAVAVNCIKLETLCPGQYPKLVSIRAWNELLCDIMQTCQHSLHNIELDTNTSLSPSTFFTALELGMRLRTITLKNAPVGAFYHLHRHTETLVTLVLEHTCDTAENYANICQALAHEFPQLCVLTDLTLHLQISSRRARARLNDFDLENYSVPQKPLSDAAAREAECRRLLNIEWKIPAVTSLCLKSDERLRFPQVMAPQIQSFVGTGVTVHEITSILKNGPLLQNLDGEVLVAEDDDREEEEPAQEILDRQNEDANILFRTALAAGGSGRRLETVRLGYAHNKNAYRAYSYFRLNGETLQTLGLHCRHLTTLKCESERINERQLVAFLQSTATHLQDLSLQYGRLQPILFDPNPSLTQMSLSSVPVSDSSSTPVLLSSTPVLFSSTPVLFSSTPVLLSSTSVLLSSTSEPTAMTTPKIKLERLEVLSVSVPHHLLTRTFDFSHLRQLCCEMPTANRLASMFECFPELETLRLLEWRYGEVPRQFILPCSTDTSRSLVHTLHVDNPGRRVSTILSWCAATLRKLVIESGTSTTLVTLAACGHIAPRLERLRYSGSWRTARSHELFSPLILAFRFLHKLNVDSTVAQLRMAGEPYNSGDCESHRVAWYARIRSLYESLPAPTDDPKKPLILSWNISAK